MPRQKSTTVPLPKDEVRRLIDDCLGKKGMTRQDFAAAVGLRFPREGQEPRPLSDQTISNQLAVGSSPLTMNTLAKWCTVLEYPIDDLLAGYEYVDPDSLGAMKRELRRALDRISDLETEVRALKEVAGHLFT